MLMILPVFIVIFVLISISTGIVSTSALKEQAHENAQLLSHSYAHQLNSTLILYQIISTDLGSASITAINIGTTLQVFRNRYPQFKQIFYTSAAGNIVDMSPYNRQYTDINLSDYEGWKRAFDSKSFALSEPGIYFGLKSVIFYAPATFAYVKHGEPSVNGVLVLVLPLSELFQDLQNINVGHSGSLFVLDEKSIILHHNNDELILSPFLESSKPSESLGNIVRAMTNQKSGFGTFTNDTGSQYISFSPIASVKWSLGVNGSYEEIMSGITRIIEIL